MYNKDIKYLKKEIIDRVCKPWLQKDINQFEDFINDTIYFEQLRLKKENKKGKFQHLIKELIIAVESGSKELLYKRLVNISELYVEEIIGHFNKSVYNFTTQIIPSTISFLVNNITPKKLIKNHFKIPPIENNIVIKGNYEHIKKLDKKGTIVILPTHISNLDSPIIGWVIYYLGISPLLYGAGLNLFNNKIFAFFMSNLGAYTVDRRKKNRLYKELLKEYATISMELGYGNLFFPGGTRSRSGKIETNLKKGLLGTGLQSYLNNCKKGNNSKKIFFIPLNLNYQVVLEANTLIDDFLAEEGKSRYIIDDDESFKFFKISKFVYKLASLNSKIVLNFGKPIDPFGNYVDEDGNSINDKGEVIDINRYIYNNNRIIDDQNLIKNYTNKLSKTIKKEYYCNNTIMSVHFVSYIIFELLREENNGLDIFKFINKKVKNRSLNLENCYKFGEKLLKKLKIMFDKKEIDLSDKLKNETVEKIFKNGLKYFNVFQKNALYINKNRIYSDNIKILYYYRNRLDGYEL